MHRIVNAVNCRLSLMIRRRHPSIDIKRKIVIKSKEKSRHPNYGSLVEARYWSAIDVCVRANYTAAQKQLCAPFL